MIIYTDTSGNIISHEEILNLDNYFIYYVDSNERILRQEYYRDQKQWWMEYYVYSISELESLLQTNPTVDARHLYQKSGYFITEILGYEDGILRGKGMTVSLEGYQSYKEVFQADNFNMATGNPEPYCTRKTYYQNGEEVYRFYYDDNGDCKEVCSATDPFSYFHPLQIGTPRAFRFSWDGFEYFRQILPIIPPPINQ
jgi:hypothetical protein